MWQKKILKHSIHFVLLFSFIYLMSCDIYKSEKSTISGIDKAVCEQFSDSVFTPIESVPLNQYFADVSNKEVATVAVSFIDSLVADSFFVEQNSQNAYELTLGAGDTTYLAAKTANGTLTIFATGIVDLNVFGKDGKDITLTDDTMPLATISGCTELSEGGKVDPLIKMRLAYDIGNNNVVLLQFIKVEQTKSRIFKLSLK